MKLLMLVSRLPWPLEKGDKLRAYHQLCLLARKHEVHLCCLSDHPPSAIALSHLRTITPHVYVFQLSRLLIAFRLIRAIFSDKPYQVHYFFQSSISRKLQRIIAEIHPDHIYCQLIRTSEYVKHMHHYKKTLDYMDALSAGYQRRLDASQWWQRPFVRDEAQRLAAYENLIFEYFDKHTIISRQDQQRILHPKRNEIVIVSNGVDTNYFNPREAIKKYDLVFTGNMSYPPNVECARRIALEILPIIKEKFPTIKLLIAGATPLSTVQELASDNVYVSGWMEDIREAYAGSQIFVAPMRTGSGLQNKLLEAMSMKMACVTTALAAHPLEAKHDQQLMIGETNAQIAAHILLMLNDEKKANALAKSAREFVVERFNWKSSVEVLEQLFEGA